MLATPHSSQETSMIRRISAACDRLKIAHRFSHNYLKVIVGFTTYKLFKTGLIKGDFKGLPFVFRSSDVEALKEVLVFEEYDFAADYLKAIKAPRIADIGHHIGTFSLWALSVNPMAEILGVEADALTFNVANENTQIGAKQSRKWRVVHRAAWKNDEKISCSTDGDTMGHKVSQAGTNSVQGIPLTQLMEELGGAIDLMKIDIEGAEEAFLAETPELLTNVNAVIIEIHPEHCSEPKVRAILEEHFDKIERMSRENSKPLLWCMKTKS